MTALSAKFLAPAFFAASILSAHAEDTATLDQKKIEAYNAAAEHILTGVFSGIGGLAGVALSIPSGIPTVGAGSVVIGSVSALALSYSVVELDVGTAALGLAVAGHYDDSLALSQLSKAAIKTASSATTIAGSGTLIADSVIGTTPQNAEKHMAVAANVERFAFSVDGIVQASLSLFKSPHVITAATALGAAFYDATSALDGLAKELQARVETPEQPDNSVVTPPAHTGGNIGGENTDGIPNGVEQRDFENDLQTLPGLKKLDTVCNPGSICVTAPRLYEPDQRELEKLIDTQKNVRIKDHCEYGPRPCVKPKGVILEHR